MELDYGGGVSARGFTGGGPEDGEKLEGSKVVRLMWQNQSKLHQLKYVSPLLRAPTCFKRYNPLACRVTSR
jgi:hypothetical protein